MNANQKREEFTHHWLEAEPSVSAYVFASISRFHDAEDVIQRHVAAMINHPTRSDKDFGEDSFNVLPAILGTPHENLLRPSMIVHSPNGNFAIRRGPWKYIEGEPSPPLKRVPRRDELHAQLYNLSDDIGEQRNLIDKHPEIAQRLKQQLATFESELRKNLRPAGVVSER